MMRGGSGFHHERQDGMTDSYVLYGSYASYYTAKVRACLRKKGIPFVERLPSAPRFREHVRPTSGSHRIPQLETPDGAVLQDSVEIVDHLEAQHPGVPAFPRSPRQRLAVHLMELFGSEGLVRLAWQFRWYFPDENDYFVKMDFGRSFKPEGSDEELLHYGNVIAERMLSRGALEDGDAIRAALREEYVALLEHLEAHFRHHPYLLGGHPSNADYAVMGALHAHMGRDPAPLRVMQAHAPRVFRWVEHMLVPEIRSPEFYEHPIEFFPDDALPDTFETLLKHLAGRYGPQFSRNARSWAAHARLRANEPDGTVLSEPGDQPTLEAVASDGDADSEDAGPCNLYHAWVAQRVQRHYRGLPPAARESCEPLIETLGLDALVRRNPVRWLDRRDNRLLLGTATD